MSRYGQTSGVAGTLAAIAAKGDIKRSGTMIEIVSSESSYTLAVDLRGYNVDYETLRVRCDSVETSTTGVIFTATFKECAAQSSELAATVRPVGPANNERGVICDLDPCVYCSKHPCGINNHRHPDCVFVGRILTPVS
jgi:hypothetical protein